MGDLFLIFLVLLPLTWVAGAVWFFRGPAEAADRHLEVALAAIADERDRVLFRRMYQVRRPRNVLVAWVLTTALSPTISYVYQREWPKAVIALLTLQGFGVWWLVSVFTMPTEVMRHNKRLIDDAFTELQLARTGGTQQINVFTAGGDEREATSAGGALPQPEA